MMPSYRFEIIKPDNTHEAFDCESSNEGEALAYAEGKRREHGAGSALYNLVEVVAVIKPTKASNDTQVQRHLTLNGVEYRAVNDQLRIATLSRTGRFWIVTPTVAAGLPRLSFKSQRAADAYAYAINLERIEGP